MAEIYGLYSCKDGVVRYVGQTGGQCGDRFEQHKRHAWNGTQLGNWLHSEWRQGYPVECVRLAWCEHEERHQVETAWMSKFPDLLNQLKVRSYSSLSKPPIIREIKQNLRDHVFNVGGFRGIHWWRQIDRYAVYIWRGSGHEWLLGDTLPGYSESEGGNIWFSDLTLALKARDEHRKLNPQTRWLPDVEQDAYDF